ncbi:hypothetical protein DPMN_087272 [Dreissena polymorpha]|uniref:Uncharacterized protein n=1 Tax=Dreissena polymorpha TaxID=45954 RepID=A0A9D4KRX2_DREPO|nr:hypothetical protein DPMN_087272 [Dreissena polymorpha]
MPKETFNTFHHHPHHHQHHHHHHHHHHRDEDDVFRACWTSSLLEDRRSVNLGRGRKTSSWLQSVVTFRSEFDQSVKAGDNDDDSLTC